MGYVDFREGRVSCGSCRYSRLLTSCDGKDGVCCVLDGCVSMAASVLRCHLGLALLRLFNCYLQVCGSIGCSSPFVVFSFISFFCASGTARRAARSLL